MILKMTLQKKWFEMILSGEKKTEYREVKPYWIQRIFDYKELDVTAESFLNALIKKKYPMFLYQKRISQIHFFNGGYFSKNLPNFKKELLSTYFGKGVEDWGAEKDKAYLCFCLGKIVDVDIEN